MRLLRVVAIGALVALAASGCGSSHVVATPGTTSTTRPPAVIRLATPAGNKEKARAEAKRLLDLVVAPAGSTRIGRAPGLSGDPPMGKPISYSVIDEIRYWRVPESMNALLAWFQAHHPGGLAENGSGTLSDRGVVTSSGYSYAGPSNPAWTGAEVEVSVAPDGAHASYLRADGLDLWIDPIPYR